MESALEQDFLADERQKMLFDTIREVNSTLDLEELLVRVVDRAVDLSGAERGILILNCSEGEARVRVCRDRDHRDLPRPVEYSHQVVQRVLRSGEAENHEIDLAESGEYPLTESIIRLGLRTVMCAPLVVEKAVTGALYVDSQVGPTAPFRESDLRLFRALSDQIAIAIENARLRRSELERKGLEERMRIAGEIQQGLFPPGGLRENGYDIHGLSRPCDTIGGDYFDYISDDHGRVRIVQGDVAGHGLKSALYMLTARAHFRSTLAWEDDPVRAFRHINGELTRIMPLGKFMTFVHVELDAAGHTIRYVNAGHEPPLLFRRRTGEFRTLGEHGPPFSIFSEPRYRVSEPIGLEPGDLLVLATDGIPEARVPGPDGRPRFFGTRRLKERIRSLSDRPARDIVHAVIGDVTAFLGDTPVDDDLTLVVLRVLD